MVTIASGLRENVMRFFALSDAGCNLMVYDDCIWLLRKCVWCMMTCTCLGL